MARTHVGHSDDLLSGSSLSPLASVGDRGKPATFNIQDHGLNGFDQSQLGAVGLKVKGLDRDSTAKLVLTDSQGHTFEITVGNNVQTIDLSGLGLAPGKFTSSLVITDSKSNVTTINGENVNVFCFLAGTRIATPAGEVSIESLAAGDLVLTADGEARPVRWLGRQTISRVFADAERTLPVRIAAGALGASLPARDLLVSPDHALLLDGVLVQAGALVNGTTIRREAGMAEIFTYYHVELADHALVLAEGVPAETFIDNVDRLNFDNWAEREAMGDDSAAMAELAYPRVKAARQLPRSLRARIAARAEILVGHAAAA